MDEQIYFGASEVDGLNPLLADSQFALSNSSLDGDNTSTDLSIYSVLRLTEARLRRFGLDPLFLAKTQLAFGKGFDLARLTALQQAWSIGDFSLLPTIKILSATNIGGANAAFVASTNTIYISNAFLERSSKNPDVVADALIEEIGHSVDQYLNNSDSPGDEGAIFLALVSGQAFRDEELQQLYQEDDHGSIKIDGQVVAAEFQDFVGDVGDNTIFGTSTDDLIQGLDGNDSLYGLAGNDTLEGGVDDDTLYGEVGTNTLSGGAGNDYIYSSSPSDIIDGGADIDYLTLNYTTQTNGVTVNFTGAGTGITSGGGTIQGIEQLRFLGGSGNDIVDTSAANFSGASFLFEGLYGNDGDDSLVGGAGRDLLHGGSGTNTLSGGAGDDYIISSSPSDIIDGGADIDFLALDYTTQTNGITVNFTGAGMGTTSGGGTIQGIEQLTFFGGTGNDIVDTSVANLNGSFANVTGADLYGNDGDDSLVGGAGGDVLVGDAGTNMLSGGAGDDYIYSSSPSDIIDGGADIDYLTLDYTTQISGVTVNFTGAGTGITSGGGTIQGIEQGTFLGGAGNDIVDISAANLNGSLANVRVANLYGNDGDDSLVGGAGRDFLDGGAGTNTLSGGAGDDYILSSSPSDIIDGGADIDYLTLNYTTQTSGVTVNFTGTGTGITSGGGTIQGIEQVTFFGGTGDDIVDTSVANLNGSFANVTGADLYGNDGDDGLVGGAGRDVLDGGAGTNTLSGGAGDDYIYSSSPSDIIDGGADIDYLTLNYTTQTNGVTVNFTGAGTGITSGGGTIQGIEQLAFFGGAGNDVVDTSAANLDAGYYTFLEGGAGDDALIGGANYGDLVGDEGNDSLDGGDGEDTLTGVDRISFAPGIGEKDILTGGSGADLFILGVSTNIYYDDFDATTDGSNDYATITDFNLLEDKVQLQGSVSDYVLVQSGTNTNLFVNKLGSEPDELIAIFQNVTGLDLASSAFEYTSIASVIEFSSATFSAGEHGTAQVTLFRSGNVSGQVGVLLSLADGTATAPADYDNVPISITFAAGETFKIATIQIIDDAQYESNETVSLTLSNSTGGATLGTQSTATLTILNDDVTQPGTLGFSNSTYSVNEDGTPVTAITVTRTGGTDGVVSATVTPSNGTATTPNDYSNSPILVTFAPGDATPKTVTIPIVDDQQFEGNETINLTLSNLTGGAALGTQNTATLTILENDPAIPGTLSFGASEFSVRERDTNNKVVTINRTGGADGAISVTLNFSDGTATTPSDYSSAPITVNFANGESSKTVTIPIVSDSILEPNETLSLSLSNPTGGAAIGQAAQL
jgi:Ca2+-binding RTX toxin-like protein